MTEPIEDVIEQHRRGQEREGLLCSSSSVFRDISPVSHDSIMNGDHQPIPLEGIAGSQKLSRNPHKINDSRNDCSSRGSFYSEEECLGILQMQLLLQHSKLKENEKIVIAHKRGEFPLEQTPSKRIKKENQEENDCLQEKCQAPQPATTGYEQQHTEAVFGKMTRGNHERPQSSSTVTSSDDDKVKSKDTKHQSSNEPLITGNSSISRDSGSKSNSTANMERISHNETLVRATTRSIASSDTSSVYVGAASNSTIRGASHYQDNGGRNTPRQPCAAERLVTMDTSNDAAIAFALQEELKQRGAAQTEKEEADFRLALQMQEQFDSEMAHAISESSTTALSSKRYYNPYAEPFEMVHQGYTKIAPRESMRGRGRLVTGSARPTYEREHSSGYESGGGGRGGEDMSYEALSELEDVSVGLSFQEMSRLTRVTTYTKNGDAGGVPESCSICFDDYAQDQQLRVLPCFHKFHRHCIEKWLSEKQTCPVCQKSIVST